MKLQQLARIEGYQDANEMLLERGLDSVVPAICMNEGCDYTTGMEPDQDKGWCEACHTNTVKSCLVLGIGLGLAKWLLEEEEGR